MNDATTYIDLSNLKRLTKSDPSLMMELITVYLEQTPTMIQVIRQSLADKNGELLKATIHKMIPSLNIMGVDPGYERLARKVQEYDYSKGFTSEVEDMALKLEQIFTGICVELQQVFEELQKEHK
ncbi:MAG: hybrid sensor histidine kinase/response regulator [Crocinitomicaceae bacterium]|jgi:HPt (histidine-containing phosphotransfer) domain-containing protein|nr:hybrid sensor histidine kinase/response regulator [Crocinitomicaceae bacterium]